MNWQFGFALAALVVAGVFFILRGARKAGRDSERAKNAQALEEADDEQADKDRDFERVRRDRTLLERLRDIRKGKNPD